MDMATTGVFRGKVAGPTIQLKSGHFFNPIEPDPDLIDINDIAHALSNLCRFTGHTKYFYSVAQHSVYVSRVIDGDARTKLWGLLHDAPEAYIGDFNRPLKVFLNTATSGLVQAIETGVMRAIAERFGLGDEPHEAIKRADNLLLATEKRDLLGGPSWPNMPEPLETLRVMPLEPQAARAFFLHRFTELTQQLPKMAA